MNSFNNDSFSILFQDTEALRQNIFRYRMEIAESVDIDEMKDIFVDRDIFKESLFQAIAERYPDKRRKRVISLLTHILPAGLYAWITLIDVLHWRTFSSLANKLLNKGEDNQWLAKSIPSMFQKGIFYNITYSRINRITCCYNS